MSYEITLSSERNGGDNIKYPNLLRPCDVNCRCTNYYASNLA